MDLANLTAATFTAHRQTGFRVVGADYDALELLLTDVDELPTVEGAPRQEPFSLVFSGPAQPRLEQRIYRLEHDELGLIEIFLVPIGYGADGGLLYEAVFN